MRKFLSLPCRRFYSTPTLPSYDLAILDCETSGRKATFHRIIEVAAIRFRAQEMISQYTTLISPTVQISKEKFEKVDMSNEKYYSKDTKSVTHIEPHMLSNAPPSHVVFPFVREQISDSTILIGHNLRFDADFLVEEFLRAGIPNISACFIGPYGLYNTIEEFEKEKNISVSDDRKKALKLLQTPTGMICTLKLSRKILKDFDGSFALENMSKVLKFPGHEKGTYHRAMFDVSMTQHLWTYLLQQIVKKHNLTKTPPIQFFLELSNTDKTVEQLIAKYF